MKYTDSYDDRQSVPDMADEAMQQYLKDAGLVEFKDWLKIGTDPKENKLDLFWYVTNVLLIPDYAVVKDSFIYLVEVKGTNKIKYSDFKKLQEMHYRARRYKPVKVGIMIFKNKTAEPIWVSYEKLYEIWDDPRTEEGYYPEKDVDGKPKLYKVLPFV